MTLLLRAELEKWIANEIVWHARPGTHAYRILGKLQEAINSNTFTAQAGDGANADGLLPCPFCGCEAQLFPSGYVYCANSGCGTNRSHFPAEQWNTRTPSTGLVGDGCDFKNSAQWMLRALVCLANRALIDTNAGLEDEQDWPAGQEWHDLGHTSQHTFMRIARKEAGIPDVEYRAFIEKYMDDFDLDEIWAELEKRSESGKLTEPPSRPTEVEGE